VLTLTITGTAADSRLAGGAGARAGRRLLSVAAMFLGGLVGAILLRAGGNAILLVVAAVLLAAVCLAARRLARSRAPWTHAVCASAIPDLTRATSSQRHGVLSASSSDSCGPEAPGGAASAILCAMATGPSHQDPQSDGATAARVLLAEDDVLLREGIASLLQPTRFEVVAQTGDRPSILPLVRDAQPDLVVLDIRMPPTNTTEGLDAAREIRTEFPEIGILVLSAHTEVEHAMELLATGERIGYLLKTRVTDVDEFIETLERIVRGGSVMDPALVQELVRARRRDDPLAGLSQREREVLELMAEGRSNAGIARRLWVTEGTVEKHVRHILAKLSLSETDDDHRRVLAVVTFLESR